MASKKVKLGEAPYCRAFKYWKQKIYNNKIVVTIFLNHHSNIIHFLRFRIYTIKKIGSTNFMIPVVLLYCIVLYCCIVYILFVCFLLYVLFLCVVSVSLLTFSTLHSSALTVIVSQIILFFHVIKKIIITFFVYCMFLPKIFNTPVIFAG